MNDWHFNPTVVLGRSIFFEKPCLRYEIIATNYFTAFGNVWKGWHERKGATNIKYLVNNECLVNYKYVYKNTVILNNFVEILGAQK